MEEEFKSIYNKAITENKNALKQFREEVKITSKRKTVPATIITLLGVVALIAFIVAENLQNTIGKIVVIFIGVLAILGCFIEIKKVQKDKQEEKDPYNETYQNKIIKPLMKLFYNEPYSYAPNVGISQEIFEGLEVNNFNIYQATNLICGTMKDCTFKMSNVVAVNRKYNYLSKTDKHYDNVIFDGVIMEIELSKSVNQYLYIREKEDIWDKELSELKKEIKLNKYKVEIEDIEKRFNVYASNDDFARSIFHDNFIEKLLEYLDNSKLNKIHEVAIKNNYIYLMIPYIHVPGTNVILYEDRESMYKELWEEFEKFRFPFELANIIINNLEK